MKVVFLEDVPNIAQAGEVKEVAEGYGRNFLLPRKLAAPASAVALAQVKARQEAIAAKQARSEQELAELAAKIEGKQISLKVKAGAKDRLYGAVTTVDIAEELKKQFSIEVDKRDIVLDKAVRQIGNYDVSVKLGKDVNPKIKLSVEKAEQA